MSAQSGAASALSTASTLAGWAVVAGALYAVLGPRKDTQAAGSFTVTAVVVAVGAGVASSLLQLGGTQVATGNTGTGALPPIPAGAPL